MNELAVTRTQGGTAHRITPDQWERLLQEAGGVVWASNESADMHALEREVSELVRNRRSGQGFGLTARERSLVERHAMRVATRHFIEHGWSVQDVSATSPYDLRCRRRADELHVEVKGTTGEAVAVVILTRNEVIAAQAAPEAAAPAVVYRITLAGKRTRANGGTLHLVSPWPLDEDVLTPIAYRYPVPPAPAG